VQVIDLPGGNQRFANFQLTQDSDYPEMRPIAPPSVIPLDRPTVISAALDRVQSIDIREMWLHVRIPDGPWRRYQMAMLKVTGGVVGVAVYPTTLFDEDGTSQYYISAASQLGDEYFSELLSVSTPEASRKKSR
jgi:hypothetical protein